MDGLLVDTEPVWWLSESAYAEGLGFTWTLEDQHICVGGPLTRVGDHIAQRAYDATGLRHDRDQIVDGITQNVADRISLMEIDLMPGGRDLLARLVVLGIPHALVSASPRHTVEAVVKATGITSFATIVAGNDLPRTKPHPDPYLEAVRRMHVDIRSTIILEDSPNGVIGALASGARVYAVPHLVPVAQREGLQFLSSLEELVHLLD
jgi:hypothetical protein